MIGLFGKSSSTGDPQMSSWILTFTNLFCIVLWMQDMQMIYKNKDLQLEQSLLLWEVQLFINPKHNHSLLEVPLKLKLLLHILLQRLLSTSELFWNNLDLNRNNQHYYILIICLHCKWSTTIHHLLIAVVIWIFDIGKFKNGLEDLMPILDANIFQVFWIPVMNLLNHWDTFSILVIIVEWWDIINVMMDEL